MRVEPAPVLGNHMGYVVEQVTPATVDEFLHVYCHAFPKSQRDPDSLIREYADEGGEWLRGRRRRFRDVLYLARPESGGPAVGVGMITIYENVSWAVNPYIAVDRQHRRKNAWRAMREVIWHLMEQSPGAEAIVFELEEIKNSSRADLSYLRTRFFQGDQGHARRLAVPYYQPILSREDDQTVEKALSKALRNNKMHLMLIPIRTSQQPTLAHDDAVRLADFLYLDFYLDTYRNAEDFAWYERHLTDLRDRAVADLGEWKGTKNLPLEKIRVPAIRRPRVFLAQHCPELAGQLDEILYADGIDVWYWEKQRGLGRSWRNRVRRDGLRRAQAVMVLLSRNAFDGPELRAGILEELHWARKHRQLVVPIVSVEARNLMRRHRDRWFGNHGKLYQ